MSKLQVMKYKTRSVNTKADISKQGIEACETTLTTKYIAELRRRLPHYDYGPVLHPKVQFNFNFPNSKLTPTDQLCDCVTGCQFRP